VSFAPACAGFPIDEVQTPDVHRAQTKRRLFWIVFTGCGLPGILVAARSLLPLETLVPAPVATPDTGS
jgi:hypothetical protein